ncbi:LysR family transcriptional regulator [Modicisalibacter xianhensis]|uniref:LysR family transcriptional regulator n=1 Tax=Modicisalibacter xianhensis TaxID=442341 RepID=A0A1I2ZM45_9GAMM|nr:LysR family transcriptional regulator [Halomonas xianhensis]TDX28393.1 LysR family transcriptional regulator [Halomonas xianhensis]SFH38676.1 LysR family transcriptional regulator, mexEF-oprN operon transcriptional activator [Halomonas xianhensis]
MNRNDLRRVDFHLLVVFETLMHERSVTHAAEKLFLGQPAISAALSRLRHLFNDPLFVRAGRTMEPTSRALEIYRHLHPALDSITQALSTTQAFDPFTSYSTFRIGLSDDVEFSLFPRLLRQLRYTAPNVTLVIRRANYLAMPDLLHSSDISLGVCCMRDLPADIRCKELRHAYPKVLRADTAPEPLSLETYCSRPHALVSFAGDLSGCIDTHLAKMGCKRKVILAVSDFSCLGALLSGTDIIATVPDYLAAALQTRDKLRAEDVPFDVPAFTLSLAWRSAQDNDPAEFWLRALVQSHFGNSVPPIVA